MGAQSQDLTSENQTLIVKRPRVRQCTTCGRRHECHEYVPPYREAGFKRLRASDVFRELRQDHRRALQKASEGWYRLPGGQTVPLIRTDVRFRWRCACGRVTDLLYTLGGLWLCRQCHGIPRAHGLSTLMASLLDIRQRLNAAGNALQPLPTYDQYLTNTKAPITKARYGTMTSKYERLLCALVARMRVELESK